jgi:phosphatidylinositol-3-phosphatase
VARRLSHLRLISAVDDAAPCVRLLLPGNRGLLLLRACLGPLAALILAAAIGGCGGKAGSPPASSAGGSTPVSGPGNAIAAKAVKAPAASHTIVIVLENREFGEVVGAADAAYFNRLAARGALAVNYYAIRHPSLPNYLAMTGGSTFGITEDCADCHASGPNLATQLSAAGVSWRAYMGGMPSPCFRGAEVGDYAKKHNPFMYFPSVVSDPSLCARDVPETQLRVDLAHRHLPAFAWISPDLCEDAHDCGFGAADEYLHRVVPLLLGQLGPGGLLVVTFDEGTTDAGCCGNASGGRIATILLGPDVRAGTRLRRTYSPYSLLATIEDRFGVPHLRDARSAPALDLGVRQ